MSDRKSQLGGCQRACKGGVRIAVHENRVRTFGEQDRLQARQHPGGLLGLRSPADAQGVVGPREVELPEEDAGHSLVPVLPGVHEHVRMAAMQGWQERCRLDQLRACPDDADDPQLVGSLAGASG